MKESLYYSALQISNSILENGPASTCGSVRANPPEQSVALVGYGNFLNLPVLPYQGSWHSPAGEFASSFLHKRFYNTFCMVPSLFTYFVCLSSAI